MKLSMLKASALMLAMVTAGGSAKSQTHAVPDLNGFWTHGFSLGFDPPPEGGLGPIHDVKTRAQQRAMGQYLFYQADLTHPALRPWVVEELKKSNEDRQPTKQETCYPSGVPNFWSLTAAMQVVQTKDYVVFVHGNDHQVRIVDLNRPHVPNPEPSWYGDSIGHFEDDTLVVDTIGLNDKSLLDVFNTPHTSKEHAIERIRTVQDANGGKTLEVLFTVEDPGAFTMPWSGLATYHRIDGPDRYDARYLAGDLLTESVCAENNVVIGIPSNFTIPTETSSKFR
jgi:hypothetical protein